MTRHITRVAPSNSLILIFDNSSGNTPIIPEHMKSGLVAATSSCIAVGTLAEHDGDTLILLSNEAPPAHMQGRCVYIGQLSTPSRTLSICAVSGEEYLRIDTNSFSPRVYVWANDANEPDEIYVQVNGMESLL